MQSLKEKYNFEYIKKNKLLLFEAISGSRAYGTAGPASDTDIKGVFILEQADLYGLDMLDEISDDRQDIKYYEIGNFLTLLLKNNPNILELLNTPPDCLIYKHPLFDELKPEIFLSKLCKDTFGRYASQQIKKARGLNKKITNPMLPRRKSILDFCYVIRNEKSQSLKKFLKQRKMNQLFCGIAKVPHAAGIYALFYDSLAAEIFEGDETQKQSSIARLKAEKKKLGLGYKGIIKAGSESNEIRLSSIPKGERCEAVFAYNQDGYTRYCKDYKAYWQWVEQRNPDRYRDNISHGKNYDAKNMSHCFRLLDMAAEIACQQEIIVRRPNREFLLKIKKGDFSYEELLEEAESKVNILEELYESSSLPAEPDKQVINKLLITIRRKFYGS